MRQAPTLALVWDAYLLILSIKDTLNLSCPFTYFTAIRKDPHITITLLHLYPSRVYSVFNADLLIYYYPSGGIHTSPLSPLLKSLCTLLEEEKEEVTQVSKYQ